MDIKQMRREITELIDSIKEHSDDLTDRPHIPTLEFELILAKVEKLFKQLVLFNHYYSEIETSNEKVEVNSSTSEKKTESAAAEKKTEVKKDSIQRTWPDLKNLIGLNQKFQVVSELFKGDQAEFNEAVNQINSLYNKEEALIYVQGLKAAFGWKDDSKVAEEFIKVVMNRYQ